MDFKKLAARVANNVIPLFTKDRPNVPVDPSVRHDTQIIGIHPGLPDETLIRYDRAYFALVPTRDIFEDNLSDSRNEYTTLDMAPITFQMPEYKNHRVVLFGPEIYNADKQGVVIKKLGEVTKMDLKNMYISDDFEMLNDQ